MKKYKLIGTGTTNAQGIARCNNNYVGTGKGEVDFVASTDNPIVEGSLLSETYTLLDTLFYDEATSSRSASWSNGNGLTIVTEDNCTKLSVTNSNSAGGTSKTSTTFTGDFECLLQVNIPSYNSSVGQYIGLVDSNNSTQAYRLVQIGWRDVRIKRISGEITCEMKTIDSTTWTTISKSGTSFATTEPLQFFLQVYNQTGTKYEIHYKNLEIYHI